MSFYGTCSIAYTHTQSHSMRYYAVLSCCTSRGLGAAHRGPPQFAPTKMALEEDPLMDVDDCGSEAGFTGDGDFDDAASAIQSSSAATSRGGSVAQRPRASLTKRAPSVAKLFKERSGARLMGSTSLLSHSPQAWGNAATGARSSRTCGTQRERRTKRSGSKVFCGMQRNSRRLSLLTRFLRGSMWYQRLDVACDWQPSSKLQTRRQG